MKRILLIIPLLFLTLIPVLSQSFFVYGIAEDNWRDWFKTGDTVKVYGVKFQGGSADCYLLSKKDKFIEVNKDKLRLLDDGLEFWDRMWFRYGSGQQLQDKDFKTKMLENDTIIEKDLGFWENSKLIVEDEILYEYLYRVLKKVIPGSIHKGKNYIPRILVLSKSDKPVLTYGNGLIVLSTDYILKLKDEEHLIKSLSKEVAKIIMNDKPDYELKKEGNKELMVYSTFVSEQLPKIKVSSKLDFLLGINTVIISTAWFEYTATEYKKALDALSRLDSLDLLSDNEIVLKSRIYRKLYSNTAKSLEAISFLEKAIEEGNGELIDLYLEKTFFYLRLGSYDLAQNNLNIYKEGVAKMDAEGMNTQKEKIIISSLQLKIDNSVKSNTEE